MTLAATKVLPPSFLALLPVPDLRARAVDQPADAVRGALRPALHVVLVHLRADVVHDVVLADARAVRPVEHAPGREVAAAAAQHVRVVAARGARDEDGRREDRVPAAREELLEREQREEEVEGQDVVVEQHSGEVQRQEVVEEVAGRVVVGGADGEGCGDAMVPSAVLGREEGARAVQDVLVQVKLEDLGVRAGARASAELGWKVRWVTDTYTSECEALEQVRRNLPRQWEPNRDVKDAAELQDAGEEDVDPRDQRDFEDRIENAPTGDAQDPSPAVPQRHCDVPLGLDRDSDAGHTGVQGEGEQTWNEVEQDTDNQRAEELHLKGGMRHHKGRPCHVEEEEVQGGRVAREHG